MGSDDRIVHVAVPGAEYDVTVGSGVLGRAGELLRVKSKSKKAMVVTDAHVGPPHLPALEASLKSAGFEAIVATMPAGEEHKTLSTLLPVFDGMLGARIDRDTPLLALGGGVVGDMAGFVAASLLRGVPFVQIPTTLLAMVDASVGGKTGVNHPVGKNLIGAFHQPIAVMIDPQTLLTLPARELRGGLAECIKHDIIRDAEGFGRLEREIDRAIALDIDYLTDLISHNVAIKAAVVADDPRERGKRAHLNLGHTFGHAIETVSNYAYSHGEAVGLGMIAAAHLAMTMGLIDEDLRRRIANVVAKAGLPTGGLWLDPARVVAAMAFDKKVAGGAVRFVLPDRLGSAVIRGDAPRGMIEEAVKSLRS